MCHISVNIQNKRRAAAMNQKSFFERLLIDCNQATGLEIGFPQEYAFDNFATLKSDLESLANKYGLTIPAKLKRGKLIFELKTVDQAIEMKKSTKLQLSKRSYSLSYEEVKAIECAF